MKKASQPQQDLKNTINDALWNSKLTEFYICKTSSIERSVKLPEISREKLIFIGILSKEVWNTLLFVSLTKEWLRAWEWVSDCVSDCQSEAEVWLHALVRGYVSDSEIEG